MKRRPAAKPQRLAPALVEHPADTAGEPDFPSVRRKINDLVAREALEMVGGAVDAAKEGQYGAMKCLFEIVGLFPAPVESVEDPGEGLVETLLRKLEVEETPDLASAEENPQTAAKALPSRPIK